MALAGNQIRGASAFVTGGAQGIGLGICRALANAGARVAIADIDADALARAKAELGRVTSVEAFNLDVRDRARYARVADDAEAALGPISIVCNNAGVGGGDTAGRMTYQMWDWLLGINIGGVVNGIQTFAPRMIERGSGHIVNTASGAGLATDPAWRVGFMYPMSKYAVVGLSEALQVELGEHGIGVSVLCPGPVATAIQSHSALARPPSGEAISREQLAGLDEDLGRRGVSPDHVGEMVVAGILENQLFILTDRTIEHPFNVRRDRVIQSLP